jgi:competence ComEA-like helix-hairpin-helix protein
MKWFWAFVVMAAVVRGAELEKLEGVKLLNSPANDGDSFLVQAGEKKLHLRLYFVDCPEVNVTTDVDAKRVREQAGYFGLTNVAQVVAAGAQAKTFTANQLAKPFTVYTAYSDALGRSPTQRFYAFVVTGDRKDLGSELVERGFARAFGAKRSGPDGTSTTNLEKRYRDLETRAMLKREGLWKNTDPDEIVRQREVQREAENDIKEVRRQISDAQASGLVDLNKATSRELQSLPGIGPALAGRIIAGRPYKSVDDLLHVRGVGPSLMEKIRSRVTVEAK